MDRILEKKGKKTLCAAVLIMMTLIALTPLAAYAEPDAIRIVVNQAFNASNGVIAYRLKPLEPGNPMPEGSTAGGYEFTITGTGSAEIVLSGFRWEGVYRYELFQVIDTGKSGYVYDKRVYTIEAHTDEALDVKVVIYNQDGTKAESIAFRNSHNTNTGDKIQMPDPVIRKTVFGNPGRSSTFAFRLAADDPAFPMPPGSANGIKTVYITGSGSNEFGVWDYDQAGTYYYTVYEVNAGESGYTYDSAVYTITDMVREENGNLELTRVVTNNANKPVASLIFNNYYNAGGTETQRPVIPPTSTTPPPSIHLPVTTPPTATDDREDYYNLDNAGVPGGGLEGGNLPKTGDESDTTFYAVLLIISSIVAIIAVYHLFLGENAKRGVRPL